MFSQRGAGRARSKLTLNYYRRPVIKVITEQRMVFDRDVIFLSILSVIIFFVQSTFVSMSEIVVRSIDIKLYVIKAVEYIPRLSILYPVAIEYKTIIVSYTINAYILIGIQNIYTCCIRLACSRSFIRIKLNFANLNVIFLSESVFFI